MPALSGRVLDVRPTEQVARCFPLEQSPPPTPLMFRPVVDHVAALAKGREVGVRVVGRVVVAMSGGKDHPRRPHGLEHIVRPNRETDDPPSAIAPGTSLSVPPAAVAEMPDGLPMRSPAALTAALGATEADHSRQLWPVDGVEEAMFAPDRHFG